MVKIIYIFFLMIVINSFAGPLCSSADFAKNEDLKFAEQSTASDQCKYYLINLCDSNSYFDGLSVLDQNPILHNYANHIANIFKTVKNLIEPSHFFDLIVPAVSNAYIHQFVLMSCAYGQIECKATFEKTWDLYIKKINETSEPAVIIKSLRVLWQLEHLFLRLEIYNDPNIIWFKPYLLSQLIKKRLHALNCFINLRRQTSANLYEIFSAAKVNFLNLERRLVQKEEYLNLISLRIHLVDHIIDFILASKKMKGSLSIKKLNIDHNNPDRHKKEKIDFFKKIGVFNLHNKLNIDYTSSSDSSVDDTKLIDSSTEELLWVGNLLEEDSPLKDCPKENSLDDSGITI